MNGNIDKTDEQINKLNEAFGEFIETHMDEFLNRCSEEFKEDLRSFNFKKMHATATITNTDKSVLMELKIDVDRVKITRSHTFTK